MKITWHGHAFFEIEDSNGNCILVDPFVGNNPWNDLESDELNPDIVAVTHGHFDHLNDALLFDSTIIGQPEIVDWLSANDHEDTISVNIGGTYALGETTITMTRAFHSSGLSGSGAQRGYGGTPAGYVIEDANTTFYHAGDTGLFGDMKTVVRDIYQPDIAALPIGDRFTMGPETASIAVEWLGVDDVIPIHYDTFEAIEQDPGNFERAVEGATVHVMDSGQTVELTGSQ
jgi:L-ascorbate metabolism protein UlaG (beta-lactamase superfamily)